MAPCLDAKAELFSGNLILTLFVSPLKDLRVTSSVVVSPFPVPKGNH